jgi:hypothetical protein
MSSFQLFAYTSSTIPDIKTGYGRTNEKIIIIKIKSLTFGAGVAQSV